MAQKGNIISTDNTFLDIEARRIGMNNSQRVFADAYIANNFKASNAIEVSGHKNVDVLYQPKVQQYLRIAVKDSMKRLHIDKDSVINVLADIAFMDPTSFYCELSNEPIPLVELTKQQRNAIKEVNTYRSKDPKTKEYITTVTGYTLHDKPKALEMLGKHFGIFELDNNQSRDIINQQINIKWN